jgi:hypothetical protein
MSALLSLPTTITDKIMTGLANGETGGTFNVNGRALPTDGYFVGGVVPSLINPTRDKIAEFVEFAPADYVGYWEDSTDYALYVDAVTWVRTEREAERLATLRGEIAYWDIRAEDEVRVRESYEGANV